MIERLYQSIVTMNSRDLFFNIVMLLCIFLLKKTEVESAPSGSATAISTTLVKEYEDVTLGCDMTGISTYRMAWKKLGAATELSGDRFIFNRENRTLTIKKASRADVGEYECVFIPDPISSGTGNVSANPVISSDPFVDAFHGSVSPLQGDDVTIHCTVYGYPLPNVTWLKGDTPLNTEKNKTILEPYRGVANASLTLIGLESDDRAYYTCKAGVNASETILVRVKDRYAALWPFIGIIAEVVVLVLVILIYEKRKSKSSGDDDSDTHSGNKTNSHGQKGGDLRQRNIRT